MLGSPLPFTPELIAGASTDQAGGYTDFSLLLQARRRSAADPGWRFKAPEGLTGVLAEVTLCQERAGRSEGMPGASKIGHTVVGPVRGRIRWLCPRRASRRRRST